MEFVRLLGSQVGVIAPKTSEKESDKNKELLQSVELKTLENENYGVMEEGYVYLITNVASYWGATKKNYEAFNKLQDDYNGTKLRILLFPSNDFAKQEPKSPEEIRKFVKKYNIKDNNDGIITIFEKISVNNRKNKVEHPIYTALKMASDTSDTNIAWNFATKFIVSSNLKKVYRFDGAILPTKLTPYIDELLKVASEVDDKIDEKIDGEKVVF